MTVHRCSRSTAQGRYSPDDAPGEWDATITPRTGVGVAGVVYLHGRSGSYLDVCDPRTRKGTWKIAKAIGHRWPMVAADLGPTSPTSGFGTWGHPATQQARALDAVAYLRDNVIGDPDAVIAAVGTSMGGLGALLTEMNHPGTFVAVAGLTPVVDLHSVRATGFSTAEINAVWGVTPSGTTTVPLPAGANPATRTADLHAPFAAWYSSGDTIVLPSTVTSFASAVGGTATLVGSMAHENVPDAIDPDEVVAFLAAHLGAP